MKFFLCHLTGMGRTEDKDEEEEADEDEEKEEADEDEGEDEDEEGDLQHLFLDISSSTQPYSLRNTPSTLDERVGGSRRRWLGEGSQRMLHGRRRHGVRCWDSR